VLLAEWCHFLKETEISAETPMGWLIYIGGDIPDSAKPPEGMKKAAQNEQAVFRRAEYKKSWRHCARVNPRSLAVLS
jgi:hypothetical protein